MAKVSSIAEPVRAFTGGLDHFEIEAATVRALLAGMDARFPGLAEYVGEHMAIAIDGAIHHDGLGDPLAPDAEVVLIPRITAG
jgi:molybdopterin converting factor small subunit